MEDTKIYHLLFARLIKDGGCKIVFVSKEELDDADSVEDFFVHGTYESIEDRGTFEVTSNDAEGYSNRHLLPEIMEES